MRAWRFLLLVASMIGAALATLALVIYFAGVHSTWVELNDSSGRSVALATNLDAYRVLLWTCPSPMWRRYYETHLTPGDTPSEAVIGDLATYRRLQTSNQIIELPNGTQAEQLDRIGLTSPHNPLHRTAMEAVRVRVRAGPYKGVEAWTSPALMQHLGMAWP